MWPDTSRPPESRENDCPLSGEQMPPGCRGPPGLACRARNRQATERGSNSHPSLRSIHNDVEENQPGIAAKPQSTGELVVVSGAGTRKVPSELG